MSDSLNLLSKALLRQEGGGTLRNRFIDVLRRPHDKKANLPEESAEDIKNRILDGLRRHK